MSNLMSDELNCDRALELGSVSPRSESNGFNFRFSSCVAFTLQFIPNRCESTTVNDLLLVGLWVDPK